MIRFRLSALAAGFCIVAASAAHAQEQVTVTLKAAYPPGSSSMVTAFGYAMSPYTGTVDGVTERLNCVDFFHDVDINQTWTATQINLGDAIHDESLLLSTRQGMNAYFTDKFAAPSTSQLDQVLAVYEEAAWLSTKIPAVPASNPNETIAIQTAIWALVDQTTYDVSGHCNASHPDYETCVPSDKRITFTPTSHPVDVTSTGYWLDQANKNYKLQSDTFYDEFNVITDIGSMKDGVPATKGDLSAQEFLYMTPEPGTWALMSTGLLMLGGIAVKRRKRREEQSAEV